MRPLSLAVLVALAGCTDPYSCPGLDAAQSADALRTCAFAAEMGEAPVSFAPPDEPAVPFERPPSIHAAATFADGARLLATTEGLAWSAPDPAGGSARRGTRTDRIGRVVSVAAAPVADRYAVAHAGGRLLLRSRDGRAPVDVPLALARDSIGTFERIASVPLAFTPDGARLAGVEAETGAVVWDARTGARVWSTPLDAQGRAVALSPDGARVAVGDAAGGVSVWTVDGGALVGAWRHPRGVQSVALGAGGRMTVWLGERTSRQTQRRHQGVRRDRTSGLPEPYDAVLVTDPPVVVVWRLPGPGRDG
ncbi:WD40 repeat domain-containing protein [Rubrivirga sp. IMCC45206]|uniref:WD40 repeat domain-containing protein n=1 Tax=Rubrivirga sp. IMCC45206 TaxID=3391614 RepID=UPI00398F9AC3